MPASAPDLPPRGAAIFSTRTSEGLLRQRQP